MKIAIIGAGAMGCLFGAKLSAVPTNEVWLIDVWKEHMDAIRDDGLTMEENGATQRFDRLKAATDAGEAGICDLALVFVKSSLTGDAVRNNRVVFGTDTIALTMQNGLGNIEKICEVIGEQNVIAGTTAHGATMLGPGNMRHAGNGKTILGELDGSLSGRLEEICNVFSAAGLETELSENVLGLVWDKLMVNVGINALTGITRLPNGDLLQHPEIEELLEAAVTEARIIAEKKDIRLSFEDPVSHAKEVCRMTAANRSSMLQDITNHKKTEIDMINGAIVREGKALGIETPVNRVLTNLIKFIEKTTN